MSASNGSVVFLRVLGTGMLVLSWLPIINPKIKVVWKGSRVPMSRRSNLVFAVCMTAWFLAVFGVSPQLCAVVFVIGLAGAMWSADQDRDQYVIQTGRPVGKTPTSDDMWMALCGLDAVLLGFSLFAVFRDRFWPPTTDEQRVIHKMAWVLVAVLSTAALVLYAKRPGRHS